MLQYFLFVNLFNSHKQVYFKLRDKDTNSHAIYLNKLLNFAITYNHNSLITT